MVLEHFGDWEECQRLGDLLFAGEITLHEEIDRQFATVTAPLEDVVGWVLENVRVRPGLPELVERFHPLVVSSGLHELIEPVLAREGVEVELLANRAVPSPDGWRVIWRDESVCPVCGQACKRRTLPAEGPIVYVGDGYSDRCAALAADRVFATRGLAQYLDELGVAYEPFQDLNDVTRGLRLLAKKRATKEESMEREIVNPWTWQDQFGFVQANALTGVERVVLCAGQTSSDADGKAVHAGDMRAQVGQALDNLEKVLGQAGLALGDVVRLNYYTTDIQAFFEASDVLGERLQAAGCRPASTLLGVAALAFPEFMIEIEATAAA